MGTIYGIDLGTTYSCIAKIDPATMQPVVIEDNANASSTLPSAVAFPIDGNGTYDVGSAAKEYAAEHPERVFQFFKRFIGRNDDPEKPPYEVDGQVYDPITLSAMVLKKIVSYARDGGETVEDVIITVPAYFSVEQREATKEAGRQAGLNVLATINEPTAASLAYAQGKLDEDRLILVYDLGGGTFDVTLLQLTSKGNGAYDAKVILTDGNFKLGGCDWDEQMITILRNKFAEEQSISVDEIPPEDDAEIRASAERIKQALTLKPAAKANFSGTRFEVTLEEFNEATVELLDQTRFLVESLLEKAAEMGYPEDSITDVLMVGGSTRMKQVENWLKERFESSGTERVRFFEPDKAVAKGAAVAGPILAGGVNPFDDIITQLGLGKNEKVKVERTDSGDVKVTNSEGQSVTVSQEDAADMFGSDLPAAGKTMEFVVPDTTSAAESRIFDVAPSTFGLIVNNQREGYFVDNVIPKSTPTPVEESRSYVTPPRTPVNYDSLRLPVVQSESLAEKDLCKRVGDDYEFTDFSLQQKILGSMVIPVPMSLPSGSEVQVKITFDQLANLHVWLYIPSIDLTQELDLNLGISDEQKQEIRDQLSGLTQIDIN